MTAALGLMGTSAFCLAVMVNHRK